MVTIREHRQVDPGLLAGLDTDRLKRRINYNTARFDPSKVNLIRYEFDPGAKPARDGFYSYFRIGAEWLDEEQTQALTVVPKMGNIDFIGMLMACLHSDDESDGFQKIYSIDFDARPIRSAALSAILSPLLAVQYLMTVKRIAARGLRKGYVGRAENLSKVKGRIDFRRNERLNLLTGHRERIFCNYEEFSVDTPENRLLKRALRIAHDMISLMRDHEAYVSLSALCNHCMSAFESVSDTAGTSIPTFKANKLYHEYTEAIRLAGMMLRRQDIAIQGQNGAEDEDMVPVFRIDMALLFEHYALAMLRRRFGPGAVKYQVKGSGGRFVADFLLECGGRRIIADAKYIDGAETAVAKAEYVKQLSAYGRDEDLLGAMGYDCSEPDKLPIVPCVLLYPTYGSAYAADILHKPVRNTVKFYTCPIAIPTINPMNKGEI